MNISAKLAFWYENVKRDLPWRNSSDPYKIWISEIILQQTRVNQGIGYYERFISAFPDVHILANAERDSVLKLWQGLGYYSRADNLHETSKHISGELKGNFPSAYDELIKLKGIGPYTAAAIASIAFNRPVAAIDGNIKRVISRIFLIPGDLNSNQVMKQIEVLSRSILDKINPGRHNQAMMELGATVCLPGNPKCFECPVNIHCSAFKENLVQEFPEKYLKKTVTERYFIYLILLSEDGKTLIRKRKEGDIWKGLYEFPLIETSEKKSPEEMAELIFKNYSTDMKITKIRTGIVHALSHRRVITGFVHAVIPVKNSIQSGDAIWIDKAEFQGFAVSRLIDRYISREGF